jgi:hypothetical protein
VLDADPVSVEGAALLSVLLVPSLLPHAAMLSVIAAANETAKTFFNFIVCFPPLAIFNLFFSLI